MKRPRGARPHVPPPASRVCSTVALTLDAAAGSAPVAVLRDERRGDTWRVALERGADGRWRAELMLPGEPTIVRYHFQLAGGRSLRERRQVEGQIDPIYGRWETQDFRIAVYRDGGTAEWARDQVIYQIFPDRFAKSGVARPRREQVYGQPALHLGWDEPPEVPPSGRDFYGGDLEGVRRRLDHLADLGVTCIYFTPVFESPTNHRYDALNYLKVDPALGDEDDLRRLVADARARGIRVILDISINHMSSDSEVFVAAQRDKSAPTFRWFTFKRWPDRYVCWARVGHMPQLAEMPEVEDFLFGPRGVTRRWLDTGIAGWRLDVVPWKTLPFWRRFGSAMRESQARPSPVRGTDPLYLVSEDWTDSSRWLVGDSFDATMNYRFAYAVRGFAIRRLVPSELDDRLETLRRDTPEPAFYSQMNLLTSHDTGRLRTLLATDDGRDRRRASRRSRPIGDAEVTARLRVAVGLQLGYPGAPMVYYGEEAALEGRFAEDGRRPYPWDRIDGGARADDGSGADAGPGADGAPRLDGGAPADCVFSETMCLYRSAMRARRDSVALRRGTVRTVWVRDRDRTYGFIREHPEQTVVVLVNGGDRPARLAVPLDGDHPDGCWRDLLGASLDANKEGERLHVTLPPGTAAWLAPSR